MARLLRDCVVPMLGGSLVGLLTLASIWLLAGAPRATADDSAAITVDLGAGRLARAGPNDSVVLIISAGTIHAHGDDGVALEPVRRRARALAATAGACRPHTPDADTARANAEAAVAPPTRIAPLADRSF
jgi:hypothetical protein